ncbi:TPA: hypothetical protein EYP44_00115 [Candidatus Bathyarchaeota archaeon]|nr:hypothetical protein [Candidatus Bathyarchaeota archaeon]
MEEFTKGMIFGVPEQCVEKIKEYIRAGATYFIVNLAYTRSRRPSSSSRKGLSQPSRDGCPSYRSPSR